MKDKFQKIKAMFCPKCKSLKVKKEISIFTAVGGPSNWVCEECGFEGYIFPQISENKKDKTKKNA